MNKYIELEHHILKMFFKHMILIKIYHFQTSSFAGHNASDKYFEKFLPLMDKFMELMQGKYGKIKMSECRIKICEISDENIKDVLEEFIKYCKLCEKIFVGQSELLNIKDEMIANTEQLKYLLSFK